MNWEVFFIFVISCVAVLAAGFICFLIGYYVASKTGNDFLAVLASIFWIILVIGVFLGLVVD